MNPRDAITFVKSPTGAFLAFCLFLVVAFFVFRGFKSDQPKSKPSILSAKATPLKPQIVQSVENKVFSPLNTAQSTNREISEPETNVAPEPKAKPPELMQISLFAETPAPEPKQLSKNYAPFGRLIPCELVITVDSSSIQTPLVGLILEDVHHAGRLIIPAGTEVHGTAQIDRTRERIASGNRWTLVWQSGEELSLSGIALDREKDSDKEGWGITDGSAGLKGRIIKSDDLAEIKLFAATFVSGAAGVLTDRENTILGSQMSPTLRNVPLKGAQEVLAAYAKQIYESIQRDGFYVRVPAGKQFYLYVTQTIDQNDATLGGTRLSEAAPGTNETVSVVARSVPGATAAVQPVTTP